MKKLTLGAIAAAALLAGGCGGSSGGSNSTSAATGGEHQLAQRIRDWELERLLGVGLEACAGQRDATPR